MIDPGSAGDWLQASLMAAALGGLAAAGRWALRMEEAERATPHVVPCGSRPAPRPWQSARQAGPASDENPETYRPRPRSDNPAERQKQASTQPYLPITPRKGWAVMRCHPVHRRPNRCRTWLLLGFRLVSLVVGLPGLEPPASSLSAKCR